MLTKERMERIKECKKLVAKLPLETAIQLEKTENDLAIANRENERLRKALEFYADEDNYNRPYTEEFSDVHNEGGNIARKALGGEDGE